MKDRDSSRIEALINLLQDENLKVASLAMEQFLKLGMQAEQIIAEYQDNTDPRLRSRLHQLATIMARRKARMKFIQAVNHEEMDLWDGVCRVNKLYDPQCNLAEIAERVTALAQELPDGSKVSLAQLAALMRQHEFRVPENDLLDVDLYLLDAVLENHYGSPPLLCALAMRLAQLHDVPLTIVLFEGRFCLVDAQNFLLDPAAGWNVAKLQIAEKIHPCGRKEVWLGILSQLFLLALVEGQLRDVYHFSDLLAALNGDDLDALPYPLGG